MDSPPPVRHIRLTSHPGQQGASGAPTIRWGDPDPQARGPIVGSTTTRSQRNVVGTHSGSYGVYRALAVVPTIGPRSSASAAPQRMAGAPVAPCWPGCEVRRM